MKIVAVNGGPRKGKNTDQLLDAFIEGVRAENPEAQVQVIRLYDYQFTGCRSCFACQLKKNRGNLQCWVKDDVAPLLKDTYHADGIVFASPIYYMNVTAQLRLFWERLQYPGPSGRTVPTALIYTMNANAEQLEKYMKAPLDINSMYLNACFHQEPQVINSCDTFQYNEKDIYNDAFRAPAERKWQRHEAQFAADLEAARQAGAEMVRRIRAL
ncbi:MAG: flavodoxin family protein [Clostridia bacterium]|nr:flavodoxin family protein [Clostridia bacterium]